MWEQYKDTQLNQWPLHQVEERLAFYKRQLQAELKRYGLHFDFHVWVSDEWFCPDGVPGFAVPFYLFNSELKNIHKWQAGELEGRTDREILKYMRHELGHAIDNAFALRKNKTRQTLFGRSSQEYPESYSPKAFSRNYVRYLGDNYAQSHPDEDFAETFAFWLDPEKKWRLKNFSKTLTAKLNCMDRLMRRIRGQEPQLKNSFRIDPIERNQKTLQQFYIEYHQHRKTQSWGRVDQSLKGTFSGAQPRLSYASFLKAEKAKICRRLSRQEDIYQYEAERAVNRVIKRAKVLNIRGTKTLFKKETAPLLQRHFRYLKDQEQLAIYL